VHVWRVPLDVPAGTLATLAALLGGDELVRAARFRLPRDRQRYLVAHGALRSILARYLRRGPARLRFGVGPHGKPHLRAGAGTAPLRFNLAHADDLALVAVAWRREVGVDVEREHAARVDLDVAHRMFDAADAAALGRLAPAPRARAFFALWTAREAWAKATGVGLAEGDGTVPAGWSVRALPVDPGYAAALVVAAGPATVRCWQWTADAAAGAVPRSA
jgi:4'-phosphopantetheinyl transferase